MKFGLNNIQLAYYGKKAITSIYKGFKLVWQSISSCFGGGYWNNIEPWDNEDGWVN